MTTPLTEDFLRAAGFKWHDFDRSSGKHWLLWIGDCIPDHDRPHFCYEDFGIELAPGDAAATWWFLWLRADYAGCYSRFLCAGHYQYQEQLTALIAGLTGVPFDPQNAVGGTLRSPADATRLRAESEALHRRMTRDWTVRVDTEIHRTPDPDRDLKGGATRVP